MAVPRPQRGEKGKGWKGREVNRWVDVPRPQREEKGKEVEKKEKEGNERAKEKKGRERKQENWEESEGENINKRPKHGN